MNKTALCLSAFTLAFAPLSALAHVTLEQHDTAIGGPAKLTFRVPHGCGDKPTVKLRVLIPEGFIAAKPMPKPGWTLDVIKGTYAKTYDYFHGVKLSQGTKEISWSGSLPSDYYDEFVISGFISRDFKAGTMLYFPVVQECPGAAHRWIEMPKPGENAHDLKEPAPGIHLTPKM